MENGIEKSEGQQREQQAEKVISFLKKIDAFAFFQGIRDGKSENGRVEFNTFRDFLIRINGILRDIPIHERRDDGENVFLKGFAGDDYVPRHSDKEGLLAEALRAAYELPNKEDVQYLIPAVINAAHLFADGNGRTSRILHQLLKSYSSEEELETNLKKSIAREDSRFESTSIDTGLINGDIDRILFTRYGLHFEDDSINPLLPEGFVRTFGIDRPESEAGKRFEEITRNDTVFGFTAAHEYLKASGNLEKVVGTFEGGHYISMSKMDELFSEAEWLKLMDYFYQLKKEHVQILIDSFVHPDLYKSRDGKSNLRDAFIEKIQAQNEKSQ